MSSIAFYFVKLSISLSCVWLFYYLFLRKLTFYKLNRWYLLGYSLISFIIPLINVASFVGDDPQGGGMVVKYIPVIGGYTVSPVSSGIFSSMHVVDILLLVAGLGSLFLLVRLLVRWLALRRIRREAVLVEDAGVAIYQVEKPIIPFSFGRSVYMNLRQHSDEERSAIIQHELVHVRQRHTVDILLAEVICIINWYNPFVWLIRSCVRQNLEFIADSSVMESGRDRKSYQYHLLSVAGQSRYCLANNFNFSSLKKRIIMMNKVKSTKVQLVKFIFLAPLVTVLLLAFRGNAQQKMEGAVLIKSDTTKLPFGVQFYGPKSDKKPLLVLDGKVMPEDWDVNTLDPNTIESVSVLKDDGAKAIYGPRAKDGVVIIATKTGSNGIRISDTTKPKPLYVVDGVEKTEGDVMGKIKPADIDHINILKGPDADKKYGDKGKNGVVEVFMKKPATK